MIRDILPRLRELIEKKEEGKVTPANIRDAFEVLKGYLYEFRYNIVGHVNLRDEWEKALKAAELRDVPLNRLRPHQDWGRRPKKKAPIIVAKTMEGRYVILDGQHRVLVAQEAGETKIRALVVSLPMWKEGKRGYFGPKPKKPATT